MEARIVIRYIQSADSNYGSQAWALYRSLMRHAVAPFRMTIVCLDDDLYLALNRRIQGIPAEAHGLDIVSQYEVLRDTPGLKQALADRPKPAYYWTWASQVASWALAHREDEWVVYLDSDLYAFGDPAEALREADLATPPAEVAIHEHRFPPQYADRIPRGRYNVGLVGFRNTPGGRAAANWWAEQVRKRCESDMPVLRSLLPDGTFWERARGSAGDQGWLEAFSALAPTVVLQHPGAALAPYNVEGVLIVADADTHVPRIITDTGMPRVLWLHAHEQRHDPKTGAVTRRTGYPLTDAARHLLYAPYDAAVKAAAEELWTA